ncbi:1262_t:CDS:1, partial [Funneliformis geosporum]
YGIRHLTSKKEDRQNNPEIELNEAQFIALERNKRREREKSIKACEEKKLCPGEHTLTYGTSFESREEKALEIKEMGEQEEESKLEQSEQKNKEIKEIPQEIYSTKQKHLEINKNHARQN